MNSNKREWWREYIDQKPNKKNITTVTKWPRRSWLGNFLAALDLPNKVLKKIAR